MLFDLRGRGRRRTVRIVYSGLALLFLLGFVGFGVGSFGGGGVAELLGEKGGGGSGENYEAQVKKAKRVTVREPGNPGAWSTLIHNQLLLAASGENYNKSENEEGFTAKAQPVLREVQESWQHYLKAAGNHPSSELAGDVMRIYTTPGGLSNPRLAMNTLKTEIAGRTPNVTLYYDLAVLAYEAGDKREGEHAAKKALALAPTSDKKILEGRLNELRTGKSGAAGGGGAGANGVKSSGGANGNTTVTIPASKLGKGATKAQTITVPNSELSKGAITTTNTATTPGATTTAPATTTPPAKTAPKK
jgi:hypothetical protein